MEEINKNLEEYIEKNVLPQYDTNNVGGHGKEHIETVINRSFEIVNEFHLDINKDMVYTIAAFHDIGYRENPDQHEEVSSEKFKQDKEMEKFFDEEERKIIAEAIVDHRASLEYEARSIYGKIVSSADRETSVENMLTRSILYQADKHKAENPSLEQVIEYSYKVLKLPLPKALLISLSPFLSFITISSILLLVFSGSKRICVKSILIISLKACLF